MKDWPTPEGLQSRTDFILKCWGTRDECMQAPTQQQRTAFGRRSVHCRRHLLGNNKWEGEMLLYQLYVSTLGNFGSNLWWDLRFFQTLAIISFTYFGWKWSIFDDSCYLFKPYLSLTLGFARLPWLFSAMQLKTDTQWRLEPQKCWVFFRAAGDLRAYASLVRRVKAEFFGPPKVRRTHPLSSSEDAPSESKKAWTSEMDALLWDLSEFI